MLRLGCLFYLLLSFDVKVFASPFQKISDVDGGGFSVLRVKTHLLEECVLVGVEEASYLHKSPGNSNVCALYLVSGPDQRIELTIDYLQVDCEAGGLVSILDGWEMSGEVFPPAEDKPLESRVTNLCGTVRKRHILTSTNSATVLYSLPTQGDVFRITVRFITHPKPCNILLTSDAEIVTLRNHGLRRNCTLATAFPAAIKLVQISVGVRMKTPRVGTFEAEEGILSRCHKRGFEDMVLVGGSPGLDTSSMKVEELFCGLDSNPKLPWSRVLCDVSAVRLTSSGFYDNSVTVAVTPITSPDVLPSTSCQE